MPNVKENITRRNKKLSQKEWNERRKKVHGNRYKCLDRYINNTTKLKIICSVHGRFLQIPKAHLLGQGCPKCGLSQGIVTRRYWNEKRCREEANKYKTKTEFRKKCHGAYSSAKNNGWFDDICSHMKILGSRFERLIYAYEFPDKSVYIGLTYDIDKRERNRKSDPTDSVTKYIDETGLIPKRKQLTELIEVRTATILEGEWKNKYLKTGWKILNKISTGGVGGVTIKWNSVSILKIALKYKTRNNFRKSNNGAYQAACSLKILNDVCGHMMPGKTHRNQLRCIL